MKPKPFPVKFRLPKGALVHDGFAICPAGGIAVALLCSPRKIRFFADAYHQRLELWQPADAATTCRECLEAKRQSDALGKG